MEVYYIYRIFVLLMAGVIFFIWFAGLPGRIGKHPKAQAVRLMGWAGH